MGRWAQAARRGGGADASASETTPAPVFSLVVFDAVDYVINTTSFGENPVNWVMEYWTGEAWSQCGENTTPVVGGQISTGVDEQTGVVRARGRFVVSGNYGPWGEWYEQPE